MFALSRAVRNLESGIRFGMTHFIPIITEFTLMSALMWAYCGPIYVLNLALMVGAYSTFTKILSDVQY